MNPITQLKSTWHTIPTEVQRFLKRALLIFIIWKLIYHLFLFNGRVVDKPLTYWSTKGAEKIMQIFYPNSKLMVKEECNVVPRINNEITCADYLFLNGKKILGVADPCNALELYVLYISFLFAFPSSLKRVFVFSFIGILVIYLANIIRLSALASMNIHRINAVDMAHHYLFKFIVYAIIFGLWVLFTKNQIHNEKNL
ncbi:hypothetical protein GALL_109350 [mine drainage metagenome]|uniref:Exosortase family protein XrtF n=1 Tax=mine drainage metagenome TaxID=410659 RepID=A0A1J5SZJ5_9ZZZZ